jgi:anti-sigma factor RsiW
MPEVAEDEIPDEILVPLSDYLDNVLPPDQRADIESKIESDDAWKSAHAALLDARSVVQAGTSTLQKARAPMSFADDVTGTIAKRSAGRFFGRRTFGDRVPFVAILVVALLGLGVIAYIMWSSPTGSLKVDKDSKPGAQGSAIIDKP